MEIASAARRLFDGMNASRLAATGIALAVSIIPGAAFIGYLRDVPWLLSQQPELAVTSPVTALALSLLAVGIIAKARNRGRVGRMLAASAFGVALVPLLLHLAYGDDLLSPVLTRLLASHDISSSRTSVGTSIGIMAIALALIPSVHRRRQMPYLLSGTAMVISGMAILAYSYGTLDLYHTTLFKTMSLRTSVAIFALAFAVLILRSDNGWFTLIFANSAAGAATRRQLLFAIAGPIVGWVALRAYRDAHLGVGASLAVFVTITTAPLIWLILRDGRLMNDLEQLRRKQRDMDALHTADLREQLDQQAEQLEAQAAERLGFVNRAKEQSDNRYRILFESIDAGFCVIEVTFATDGAALDFRFLEINAAFETLTGMENAEGRWRSEFSADFDRRWSDQYAEITRTRAPARFITPPREADGKVFDVHAFPVDDPALNRVGILFTDITRLQQTADELQRLNDTLEARVATALAEQEQMQEALRQSQKMEAVGQLTGGLAHDFNNLLQGITGSLELLQSRISQGKVDNVERYVTAAQGAARRAAALTHRLLAFSRRQTLDPKTTDVNRLVAGMEEMIRRTVGPHIKIETVTAGGLWNTRVDPSQLENSLLNLCINARDAMPDGGQLVIETGNKWLDERAALQRELPAGQYVTLSVSDNGSGMPPEVVARAFDPFFTTKPLGMGTGLGLSMIYGFAKQSGGQVRIYSEVGQGTTVGIWLPRHFGELEQGETMPQMMSAVRAEHHETVLVVDDEPTVRMLLVEVLDELGYTSIEAGDGAAALKVLQSDARIDLLVTDVGLPGGMNGRQVADAARVARPGLKVLFITGYAENAVLSHGHLEAGMHVLTKPFRMEALAARIKDLIGA